MLVWIIVDKEDNNPIIAASTKELAEQRLFDYMGYGNPIHAESVKYLGFTPMIYSEYEDDFIGTYKFNSLYPNGFGDNIKFEWEIQAFYLFSIELDKEQK